MLLDSIWSCLTAISILINVRKMNSFLNSVHESEKNRVNWTVWPWARVHIKWNLHLKTFQSVKVEPLLRSFWLEFAMCINAFNFFAGPPGASIRSWARSRVLSPKGFGGTRPDRLQNRNVLKKKSDYIDNTAETNDDDGIGCQTIRPTPHITSSTFFHIQRYWICIM